MTGFISFRCVAVHPGNLVPTNLARHQDWITRLSYFLARPWSKTRAQAAATAAMAAFAPEVAAPEVGCYLCNCFPAFPASIVSDGSARAVLWRLTAELLKYCIDDGVDEHWLNNMTSKRVLSGLSKDQATKVEETSLPS